jgi:hypothetical protein
MPPALAAAPGQRLGREGGPIDPQRRAGVRTWRFMFVRALAASVKWLPDKGESGSTRTTGISLASRIPPNLLREVPG